MQLRPANLPGSPNQFECSVDGSKTTSIKGVYYCFFEGEREGKEGKEKCAKQTRKSKKSGP